MPKGQFIYHLLALIVVAIWGVTFISTKILINAGMQPAEIFVMRFIMAYLGLWCLILIKQKGKTSLFCHNLKDELLMVIVGITGGSLYFLAENTALMHTQASNVSFLVSSSPLLTTLLGMFVKSCFHGRIPDNIEKVRLSAMLVCGTILVFVGMALVIFDGAKLDFAINGDFLAVLAALSWACYSVIIGVLIKKYGTAFTSRKSFFYGLVTMLPAMIFEDSNLSVSMFCDPVVLGNLLFLGVMASLGCYVVWNLCLVKLGNVTATNYIYLNPAFTFIAAVIVLGERLDTMSALGCGAILSGVLLADVKRNCFSKSSKR